MACTWEEYDKAIKTYGVDKAYQLGYCADDIVDDDDDDLDIEGLLVMLSTPDWI